MLFSPQAVKRRGIAGGEVIEWFDNYPEVKH